MSLSIHPRRRFSARVVERRSLQCERLRGADQFPRWSEAVCLVSDPDDSLVQSSPSAAAFESERCACVRHGGEVQGPKRSPGHQPAVSRFEQLFCLYDDSIGTEVVVGAIGERAGAANVHIDMSLSRRDRRWSDVDAKDGPDSHLGGQWTRNAAAVVGECSRTCCTGG